jgi:hypothetical protein
VAVQRQPIYLYVPPAHRLHWREYCGRYAACGQPVYFVEERWVRDRWDREHYRHEDRHDRGLHRGHGHGRGHGDGHGDGRGERERHRH